MKALKLRVVNFRCFSSKEIDLDGQQIVIQGKNGAGKTSLLEAMHYASYAHSFRTRKGQELVKQGGESHFYIELSIENSCGQINKIQVGYDKSQPKNKSKSIKINGKKIQKTSEIISLYRVVSLTNDDIELIKGSPEIRRTFLNQSLYLCDGNWLQSVRQFKKSISQRHALLNTPNPSLENLKTWSLQLWKHTIEIQEKREKFLCDIQQRTNDLLKRYFQDENLIISLRYNRREIQADESFEQFWKRAIESQLLEREKIMRRNLFGAHLDDFKSEIFGRCARTFASRGEQKLITFLLKCAQMLAADVAHKDRGILLLDDFLTDLDPKRLSRCTEVLSDLKTQAIITCPVKWKRVKTGQYKTKEIRI
ncbi:DNA replication/repair protein RecF [Candidatus Dependentiae bacterium]